MASSAQAIVAPLPVTPTQTAAMPTPPVVQVPIPGSTVVAIDGSLVPVVPAFCYAAFGASGALAGTPAFTVGSYAALNGAGALSAAPRWSEPVAPSLNSIGAATGAVVVGGGGQVVLHAAANTAGQLMCPDAVFSAGGALSATVVPTAPAYAPFYATAVATMAVTP